MRRPLNFQARVDLTASGVSHDPTPDLGALSPQRNRIYIALRGPQPQTRRKQFHTELVEDEGK